MKKFLVSTEPYGDCTVEAETANKAKYQAYLRWREAYRGFWLRNPFMEFISSVSGVVEVN